MSWTLADQSLVRGANFLISVVIARFLGIEAFGAYSIFPMVTGLLKLQQKVVSLLHHNTTRDATRARIIKRYKAIHGVACVV